MSTVLVFPTATSPTPNTGVLWLTEGSGTTRDKQVPAGTLMKDLLGRAVNEQAAAASPIVGATDLLPVARGNTGGKASVDAVVGAGFAGAFPGAVGALSTVSAMSGTETLAVVQTTSKKVPVSQFFPELVQFTGLDELFPLATATIPASILGQYRMVSHRNAAGIPLYADLAFHWSATSADAGTCGWTIPDDQNTLASEIDTALRTFWGIGASDQWLFPYIFGVLYTGTIGAGVHKVAIWNEGGSPAGSKYKITLWTATEEAYILPFGQLLLHIPGRAV